MDALDEKLSAGVTRMITRFAPLERIIEKHDQKSSGHPHEEILFVISGESDYFFNGSIYHLKPGTAVLIDRWIPHGFGYTTADHDLLHCWCYHFNGKWSATILEVGERGAICTRETFLHLPQELSMVIMHRWNKLFNNKSADEQMAKNLMLAPLNLLLNEIMLLRNEKNNPEPSVSELIKSMICSCNGKDCSLKKLSEMAGLSRCHIAHVFHKETGSTIGEFINFVRGKYIADAKKQGFRLKEIAAELGFSSSGALGNWMRKHIAAKSGE